jgi:hypothetical protein
VSLEELAEGLFVKIAAIVFVAGFAFRLIFILARRGNNPNPQAKKSAALGAAAASVNWIVPGKGFLRRNPAGALAAIIFHIALFGVLLFNEFHVLFIWEDLFGLSWEPVSEQLFSPGTSRRGVTGLTRRILRICW